MNSETPPPRVIVTDVQMRFGSMIVFMIKWALASIPALLILLMAGTLFWIAVAGMLLSAALGTRSLSRSGGASTPTSSVPTANSSDSSASKTDAEAKAYISKVELIGIKVENGTVGKGVFGEVKNSGTRVLRKVEITIYYLGADGRAVSEKTYFPVLVTSMGFGQDNIPLKPGYSKKFGVRLDDAPSDWSGKVDVKVTTVEFSEPGG
jgi:hypothetical protein